jgi:nitrate/nitrite transporter NarK
MKGFLRAGHTPTLVAALLYFDVSFMAWVLLGPLAPFLRSGLGLTATQQGPIAHRSRGSTTKVRPERPYHSRLSALAVDSTQT